MATYKQKSAHNVARYNTRLFYHTKHYHFYHKTLRIFYFYVFMVRDKYQPFKQATPMLLVLSRMIKIITVLVLINTEWQALCLPEFSFFLKTISQESTNITPNLYMRKLRHKLYSFPKIIKAGNLKSQNLYRTLLYKLT